MKHAEALALEGKDLHGFATAPHYLRAPGAEAGGTREWDAAE